MCNLTSLDRSESDTLGEKMRASSRRLRDVQETGKRRAQIRTVLRQAGLPQ